MNTQHSEEAEQPTGLLLEHVDDLGVLQALADPSRLTTLTLYCCSISDLSLLARFKELTSLEIQPSRRY